jgi:hypothetical protein
MKTKTQMDPTVAFPEPEQPPGSADLKEALGVAALQVEVFLTRMQTAHPTMTAAWQFSPRAGWYHIHSLRKRRLFYLVPKHEDFRLSLILGPRALAALHEGPFAAETDRLLPTAKRYPEGTAFSFNRRTLNPDLVLAFIEAKLAH